MRTSRKAVHILRHMLPELRGHEPPHPQAIQIGPEPGAVDYSGYRFYCYERPDYVWLNTSHGLLPCRREALRGWNGTIRW